MIVNVIDIIYSHFTCPMGFCMDGKLCSNEEQEHYSGFVLNFIMWDTCDMDTKACLYCRIFVPWEYQKRHDFNVNTDIMVHSTRHATNYTHK